uniref:Mediator of RNA polymerase II transcription subunit 13 n=1 Tax=Schizophyllum commune (strain H4-8 / FGSC 9210) TaxID=578458 RepID=D8QMD4_SCHCM
MASTSKTASSSTAATNTALNSLTTTTPVFPPRISYADELLTSAFDLTRTPCLVWCRYSSYADAIDGAEAVERARLAIPESNAGKGLLESDLTSVRAGSRSRIYVFRLGAKEALREMKTAMAKLSFEGLEACIALDEIYGPTNSSTARIPSKTTRTILSHFFEAIRTRFVDDVVRQATNVKRDVQRFKTGFLFGATVPMARSTKEQQSTEDNWSAGWDAYASARPLTFVHLDIQLDARLRLLINPIFRPTSHRPLPLPTPFHRHSRTSHASHSSLSAGIPITLLPHGTAAHFLAEYTPTDSRALDREFEKGFRGTGVLFHTSISSSPQDHNAHIPSTPYIIGYLAIENRHGEPKGLTFVYPRQLCLLSTDPKRRPLDNPPELPAPLQPSPTLANAIPPALTSQATLAPGLHSAVASAASSAPVSPLPSASTQAAHPHVAASISRNKATQLFKTMVGRPGEPGAVALEVSAYVDAVAKERERERERMRAARTGSGAGKVDASSTSGAQGSTPAMQITTPGASGLTAGAGFAGGHSASASPAAPYPSGASSFYPSPPSTVPATTHIVPGMTPSVVVSPAAMDITAHHTPAALSQPQPPSVPSQPPTASTSVWGSIQDAANNGFVSGSTGFGTNGGGSNGFGSNGSNGTYGYLGSMDFSMFEDVGMDASVETSAPAAVAAPAPSAPSFAAAPTSFDASGSMGTSGSFGTNTSSAFDTSNAFGTSSSSMDMLAFDMDMAFSDADWNFFDKPGTTSSSDNVAQDGPTPMAITSEPTPLAAPITPASNFAMPPPPPAPPPAYATPATPMQHATPLQHATPMQQATPAYSSPAVHFDDAHANISYESHDLMLDMTTPQVLPPSPPQTPGVRVSHSRNGSLTGGGRFDPISFAQSHHNADNKYAGGGKFASGGKGGMLPSPPPEDTPSSEATWYRSVTDPKIGVVKRLNGVKRKYKGPASPRVKRIHSDPQCMTWEAQGIRKVEAGRCPLDKASWEDGDADLDWVREEEPPETEEEEDESDTDHEDLELDAESLQPPDGRLGASNRASRAPSEAPSLPPYLPLGPTLLRTQFRHSLLLPLSSQSSSDMHTNAASGGHQGNTAACAPTPVSPAAIMGAAAEQSKSLEATAQMVAKEVAENGVWGEVWRAGVGSNDEGARDADEDGDPIAPHSSDIAVVRELWSAVGVQSLTLGALCGVEEESAQDHGTADHAMDIDDSADLPTISSTLKPSLAALPPPHLTVAKGNSIVQVLPTALRFWDKLGLGPRAGRKEAVVYVVYEDAATYTTAGAGGQAGSSMEAQVMAFLSQLVGCFKTHHYGALIPGNSINNRPAGLFPVRFDSSIRKQLAHLHAALESSLHDDDTQPPPTTLLLFLTPLHLLSLATPPLRHLAAALLRTFRPAIESGILFPHLLPEHVLASSPAAPSPFASAELARVCADIYERVRQPVARSAARAFFARQRLITRVQAPASAIARPVPKVKVTADAGTGTLPLDAGTLLHVGYQVSASGKWVLCACVDEYGEGWETGVWLVDGEGDNDDGDGDEQEGARGQGAGVGAGAEARVVSRVWEFAVRFASKAAVDWRVAVARLGVMPVREVEAWAHLLEDPPEISPSCTAVFCVQHDAPWAFAALARPRTTSSSPILDPRTGPPSKHTAGQAIAKHAANQVYVDASAAIFALEVRGGGLPLSASQDAAVRGSFVEESARDKEREHSEDLEDDALDLDACGPLPRRTSALVRTTATAGISTLQLHLMHVRWSGAQEGEQKARLRVLEKELHADVTASYHCLAALAAVRGRHRQGVDPLLPLHLAATEAMTRALDRGEDGADVCGGES